MAFMNIKAEFRRKGITQRQVADGLGMTAGTLSLKLNERTPMTVNEAKSIKSNWLEMSSLDYLLESDSDQCVHRKPTQKEDT